MTDTTCQSNVQSVLLLEELTFNNESFHQNAEAVCAANSSVPFGGVRHDAVVLIPLIRGVFN
ncbi:MAG: hypothetical protein CL799_13195 [Chromatiales bacterium]|nr:hypothetical protein [Chromatiales bacterium]